MVYRTLQWFLEHCNGFASLVLEIFVDGKDGEEGERGKEGERNVETIQTDLAPSLQGKHKKVSEPVQEKVLGFPQRRKLAAEIFYKSSTKLVQGAGEAIEGPLVRQGEESLEQEPQSAGKLQQQLCVEAEDAELPGFPSSL